ncbi:unnamed protein product [Microthlaspi erraticum]|uniref:Uncharacterized protein n=1 Tax=Microthlaspi erraticum TaxID=1685480 RepID=A0A6D2KLJ1_9BRAS|nr:unnamed protein product [Microthlaspi erraticum]
MIPIILSFPTSKSITILPLVTLTTTTTLTPPPPQSKLPQPELAVRSESPSISPQRALSPSAGEEQMCLLDRCSNL